MAHNGIKICKCSKSYSLYEACMKRVSVYTVKPRRTICYSRQSSIKCSQNLNASFGFFGTLHNQNKEYITINLNSDDFPLWQTKKYHHSIACGFINSTLNISHKKHMLWYGIRQYEARANFSYRPETIEKKLIQLMDMWELEKAVVLVKDSVEEGIIPHQNIILSLLQQLAYLGEFKYLLELYSFLIDHKLCTENRFFECLQEAYYNSGRVDEAVLVLRQIFNKNKRYDDIDIFFTLLTVMVLRHFPDRLVLIEEFVRDLRNLEEPVSISEAGLWKCFILTERFEDAENLLLKSEDIQSFIPQMVTDICTKKNQVVSNYEVVLPKLLDVPNLKRKLRVLILETYVYTLCQNGKLEECLRVLTMARSQSMALHPDKIRQLLPDISSRSPSKYAQSVIQEITRVLDGFK